MPVTRSGERRENRRNTWRNLPAVVTDLAAERIDRIEMIRMDGLTDGETDLRTDVWTNGLTNGGTDGPMVGWTDRQTG